MSLAQKINASAHQARTKHEGSKPVELVCPLTGQVRTVAPSAVVCWPYMPSKT